jgi:glycosyltransferase involved in cell wall biosynthesis
MNGRDVTGAAEPPAGWPRRVLMTADAVGGVWDYALELAAELGRARVEVTLAVLGPAPDGPQLEAAAALPHVDLHAARWKLEWMDDPWDDLARAGSWLLALEERSGAALVHLGSFAPGALPFRGPKLVVGHSCVLTWWRAARGAPAPAAWDRYRAAVSAGLRGADHVVTPTAWMKRALEEHYGPLPRASVIPNGRAPTRFRAGPKEPFVLCAGRLWDEGKNVAALVRVAPLLPWPVRIAGPLVSPADPEAAHDARGAARAPNVTWLGKLGAAELAGELARAGIYALPARYEPFGLTVLEAALSGCALVLGDIPSLRELWDGAAWFVPPGEDDALARALAALAARPGLRAAFGERARLRAVDMSAAAMGRRYLGLYRELLAARGQGATGASAGRVRAGPREAPCAS